VITFVLAVIIFVLGVVTFALAVITYAYYLLSNRQMTQFYLFILFCIEIRMFC